MIVVDEKPSIKTTRATRLSGKVTRNTIADAVFAAIRTSLDLPPDSKIILHGELPSELRFEASSEQKHELTAEELMVSRFRL